VINSPPSITSGNTTTFTETLAGTFTVTTTPGYPVATTISEVGALPAGVTFTDNGNGTSTLAGTPGRDWRHVFDYFTAGNGVPQCHQTSPSQLRATPARFLSRARPRRPALPTLTPWSSAPHSAKR
jgi:hypothetical protein